jgi:hypothetical protein
MKKFLILLALISFSSYGQTGLYGKKSIVEIQGVGAIPLFYNLFNGSSPMYRKSGTTLVDGSNLLDYGARVNVMRAFSNQFGLGLEFGIERQSLSAPQTVSLDYVNGFSSGTSTYSIQHEKLRMNTVSIMPKLEFSSRSNLLPIGLSHQVGVGFTRVSISDRDYLFELSSTGNDSIVSDLESGLVNYEQVFTGFTVMYQINMRTPITENVVITYGIRYNANFVRRENPSISPAPPGQIDLFNSVRNRRNPSYLQLNIGIGYAF